MGILNIGNSKVDPKELIGMDPEELKSKLDSSATKEDINGIRDQVTQFNSGLSELKAQLATLTTPKPAPVVEDPTDPTTGLLLDPKGFIGKETQGIKDAQIQTQAQLQEMRARQNPALDNAFKKYGTELVALAEKYPIQQRAQPGFWEWHTRTFLGDKMLTGKIDRDSYPSLIGSSTIGPGSEGKDTDPNMGFGSEVANWLRDRNVPLTKAARISQIMEKNGDPISLSNYKGPVN